MRQFMVAAKAAETDGDTFGREITVQVLERDEETWRDVRILPAAEGALAMLLAADAAPLHQKVSASINFFFSILRDQHDIDYFKERLFDRGDGFGGGNVAEIVEGIIEEWTGNPTPSSSGSTGSPGSTGEPSTGSVRHRGSTPSAFGLTASAP
jgi:hypothetical protein